MKHFTKSFFTYFLLSLFSIVAINANAGKTATVKSGQILTFKPWTKDTDIDSDLEKFITVGTTLALKCTSQEGIPEGKSVGINIKALQQKTGGADEADPIPHNTEKVVVSSSLDDPKRCPDQILSNNTEVIQLEIPYMEDSEGGKNEIAITLEYSQEDENKD